jgi:hypothetical protein
MTSERLEGDRSEQGSAEDSERHPPHESADGDEEPNLPATAHGSDAHSTADEPEEVDDESMYDRRPGQDKDRPPSGRG